MYALGSLIPMVGATMLCGACQDPAGLRPRILDVMGGEGGSVASGGGSSNGSSTQSAGGGGGETAAGGSGAGGQATGGDACQWSEELTPWWGAVPDLAAAPGGTVHLSFVSENQVHLGQLGASSQVVPDSSGPGTRFRKPRIAWGAGAAHLVWGSSWQHIEYARKADAGAWTRESVAQVEALFSVPQIAATSDGQAHLIYQWCKTQACPNSPIAYLRRGSSGTWSAPELLSDSQAEWRDAALAADASGTVHAMWKGAFRPGQYRARSKNGSWQPLEQIDAPDGGNMSFGDLTIGPNNRPHHGFFAFGTLSIGLAMVKPNGKWMTLTAAGPGLPESHDYDMRPAIAVSPAGVNLLVWAQWSQALGRPAAIEACQRVPGPKNEPWICGQLASDSGVTVGGKPAVVFADGRFNIVWRHTDGRLKLGQLSCPSY